MMNNIVKIINNAVLILFLSTVYPNMLIAGGAVYDDPMVFATHVRLGNDTYGTGFYINDGKYLYFVTAKHVLYKIENNIITNTLLDNNAEFNSFSRNEHFNITINAQLNVLYNNNNIKSHPVKDITIVRLGSLDNNINPNMGVTIKNENNAVLTTTPITMLKQYDNVSIGNDIYVFGFPASIGIQDFPQIEYEKPLLKKGIIAGKNDKLKTIILDSFIYWGNSGGPVLEVDEISLTTRDFSIIGVITQFVPLYDRWNNIQGQMKLEISNSGYSVAEPADEIINMLKMW